MHKIEHTTGCGIQTAAGGLVIEITHRTLDFCLNKTVFRLQIKRTVLENQIIPFGDLHQLQRSGHRVGAIARQTHTPAFRQRNASAADTAARLVHERHLLLGFGDKLPQKRADRL